MFWRLYLYNPSSELSQYTHACIHTYTKFIFQILIFNPFPLSYLSKTLKFATEIFWTNRQLLYNSLHAGNCSFLDFLINVCCFEPSQCGWIYWSHILLIIIRLCWFIWKCKQYKKIAIEFYLLTKRAENLNEVIKDNKTFRCNLVERVVNSWKHCLHGYI